MRAKAHPLLISLSVFPSDAAAVTRDERDYCQMKGKREKDQFN